MKSITTLNNIKMKKYFALLFTSLVIVFSSCDDDTDPGRTAIEKMAGDWWITIDAIEPGGTIKENIQGKPVLMYTYNTAANTPTEMWMDDANHFWKYKVKVQVDYNNRTFTTADFVENTTSTIKLKITQGKIIEGGTVTPSGSPADSIEYLIEFDDDKDGLVYKLHGFRRSGFPADDF